MKRFISMAMALVFVAYCSVAVYGSNAGVSLTKSKSKMAAKSEDWTSLSGHVLMGKPWKAVEKSNIFKSKDGIVLKVVVPDGTYKFDLKAKKGFKLVDGDWKEVDIKRMLQRNNGKIIVIKASDFRVRLDLESSYKPAVEYLGGLTQQ